MTAISEVRTAHTYDPHHRDGRPLKDLSDLLLMERIVGKGIQRQESQEAARELWYRIREMHGESIACKWGVEAMDMVDATFVEVLKTAKAFFAEEGIGMERFSYRVWDRLTKRAKRASVRRKEQAVEDWGQIAGKLREQVPVGNELEEQELVTVLYEEIDKLNVELREYLRLRLGEGLLDVEIAKKLKVRPSKVFRWKKEVLELLREQFAKRGLAISASALVFMLVDGPFAGAAEARLDHLIEAAPDIVAGNELPAGTLAPAVEAILTAESTASAVSFSPWLIAASVALIGIPVSIGLGVWNPKPGPAPAINEVLPIVEAEKAPEPAAVAAPPVQSLAPLPGNFPRNPSRGQIHALTTGPMGLNVEFVWVPGDGDQIPGIWIERTEHTQHHWLVVGFLIGGEANPSFFKGDDLPVEEVTAEDVESYCKHFLNVTGVPVRLPTKVEWTHVATAGMKTPDVLPDEAELDDIAWYDKNSSGRTHPVATKKPNELGMSDVFGNVFEFVRNGSGGHQICGACWSYEDFWCQPDYPADWPSDRKNSGIGFRLVYQPPVEMNAP